MTELPNHARLPDPLLVEADWDNSEDVAEKVAEAAADHAYKAGKDAILKTCLEHGCCYEVGISEGRKLACAEAVKEIAELKARLEMPITIHGDYVLRAEAIEAVKELTSLWLRQFEMISQETPRSST